MPKVAVVGAGSVAFTQVLATDILCFKNLQDTHFALLDIDAERMQIAYDWTSALIEQEKLPATVSQTLDPAEALEGADYVIISILAHGYEPFQNEIEIPYKYGITQPVGDTFCVGGIFRALRTIPVMLEICRNVEKYCPNAWVLNYTNPMHMLTWACNAATKVKFLGLCHGVQGSAAEMATLLGMKPEDVRYWVAGINHLAWFLRFEDATGQDLYPQLWQHIEEHGLPEGDKIRWDFARYIGYYMTETSGHFSEYIPYYRKRPEIVAPLEGVGPHSRHAWLLDVYRKDWLSTTKRHFEKVDRFPFGTPSGEYAAHIINAMETNQPFRFNGNVMNHGLISNLPKGSCVEVPCFADALGAHPCVVGDLPPQCAAINNTNISSHGLTVQAALEGDREKAFYAVLLDPLTAAVCSPGEIRQMFDELFEANRKWLPQFA